MAEDQDHGAQQGSEGQSVESRDFLASLPHGTGRSARHVREGCAQDAENAATKLHRDGRRIAASPSLPERLKGRGTVTLRYDANRDENEAQPNSLAMACCAPCTSAARPDSSSVKWLQNLASSR